MENIISTSGGNVEPPGETHDQVDRKSCATHMGCRHTFGILDEDLANVVHFSQAGTPALLGLLGSLGAAGVAPHELIVVQGSICRTLGIAPPDQT